MAWYVSSEVSLSAWLGQVSELFSGILAAVFSVPILALFASVLLLLVRWLRVPFFSKLPGQLPGDNTQYNRYNQPAHAGISKDCDDFGEKVHQSLDGLHVHPPFLPRGDRGK